MAKNHRADDGLREGELCFRDPVDNAGFVALSNLVMLDPHLTDGAKVTYSLLLFFARQSGLCFPGQERLALARGGVSVRTIRNHLEELEDRKLVVVEQRGFNQTNKYWIEPLQKVYPKDEAEKYLSFTRYQPDRKLISGLTGNEFPVHAETNFRSGPEKDCRQSTNRTTSTSEEAKTGDAEGVRERTSVRDEPHQSVSSSGNLFEHLDRDAGQEATHSGQSSQPAAASPISGHPADWPSDERDLWSEKVEKHLDEDKLAQVDAERFATEEVREGKTCTQVHPKTVKAKKPPAYALKPFEKWSDGQQKRWHGEVQRHMLRCHMEREEAEEAVTREIREASDCETVHPEKPIDATPSVRVFQDFARQVKAKWPDAEVASYMDARAGGIIKNLLGIYGVEKTLEDGLIDIIPDKVILMCRLAVWDWEAIKVGWRVAFKCGRVPTIMDVYIMREWLAGAIGRGVVSQQHRFSRYVEKFVTGTDSADTRSFQEIMNTGDPRLSPEEAAAAPPATDSDSAVKQPGEW